MEKHAVRRSRPGSFRTLATCALTDAWNRRPAIARADRAMLPSAASASNRRWCSVAALQPAGTAAGLSSCASMSSVVSFRRSRWRCSFFSARPWREEAREPATAANRSATSLRVRRTTLPLRLAWCAETPPPVQTRKREFPLTGGGASSRPGERHRRCKAHQFPSLAGNGLAPHVPPNLARNGQYPGY